MPDSTSQGITFPLPGDLVRNPSMAAQLATDMENLARTADDAIRVAVAEAGAWRGPIPEGTDLDHMAGRGRRGAWGAGEDTTGTQILSLSNLPELVQGVLTVKATNTGFSVQEYSPYNREYFYRRAASNLRANPAETTWHPWQKIGARDSLAGHVRHDLLVEEMRRYTTVPALGGAAPVALIFDHGTNVFRDGILPKLQARNLDATLALNSDMYNPAAPRYEHDNDTTWAEIDSWPVEIANHGRTHGAMTTTAQLRREIVDGLAELRENLPSKRIFTWVQTGQSGSTTWQGFENGATSDTWATSAAGAFIWDHHAASTGAIAVSEPALYDMTGTPHQGVWGYWIDTPAGIATAKARIGDAIAQRRGVVIRCHPEVLGTEGRSTVAEVAAFLDWLADAQDAGTVRALTFSAWSLSRIEPQVHTGIVEAAGLLSEFTSTTSGVTLQRIGPHCEFSVRARRFDKAGASAGAVLCTLPVGYRPSALYRDRLVTHPGAEVDVAPSGTVTLIAGTIAQNSYVTFRLAHLTTDPAPVS